MSTIIALPAPRAVTCAHRHWPDELRAIRDASPRGDAPKYCGAPAAHRNVHVAGAWHRIPLCDVHAARYRGTSRPSAG